ncbi:SseB family protein [Plastorhodobacter daqingensis]|uniref:SseB family protein n=1 Tax=Plastorhodobacter daqingensis TaxID=1387281 RepID=A0ABW2UJJ2_9RHOB
MTPLDTAHAAMTAAPEDDAARLRFYERLADGEMFLLLESEPEGETLVPQVFPLEEGSYVLIFDQDERLAEFVGATAPYAALPGRVIASLLAGQGVGLGVNLGVAPSSMLIPSDAVDWLARTLGHAPTELEARPEEFLAPKGLPEALLTALDGKLARAGGLASTAYLAGVRYEGGRRGHMLAFIDTAEGAEGPLARAAAEALTFSGIDAGEMDVAFFRAQDPLAAVLARVGLRFDLPQPEQPSQVAPQPPGMDPSKPPKLR